MDEKKVEELLGVPPEKVVDYMALLGDTIDNIPGAKGIGEKGAAELIRKYGSVESALDHAAEVSNKRYREALQQQREQVLMSKQLATIATDAPIDVKPQELELRAPNGAALAELYRELGFSSLLKELGSEAVAPASSESAAQADYRQCASVAEFRKYVTELPRKEPLAIWLNLETGERESEGFGTHISSIEVSSKAGQGRSICFDEKGEALKALAIFRGTQAGCSYRPRSKTVSIANRPGGQHPVRDSASFLSAAAHHCESQFHRRGDAPIQRHARRRPR